MSGFEFELDRLTSLSYETLFTNAAEETITFQGKMECPGVDEPSQCLCDPLPSQYHDMEPAASVRRAVTTVNIARVDGTLGITLRGGMLPNKQLSKPVLITHLKPDGPAARDGTIKPGDRLVAVNGVSLRGSTLAEAQTLLKQPSPTTSLTIEYDVKLIEDTLRTNGPILIEIERLKGEDLGLTLYQSEDGVLIEHVKRGSIADRCGALYAGDEIVAVNNRRIDTKPAIVEDVAKLLEQGSDELKLEILPARSPPLSSNTIWRGRVKPDEPISPMGCGWLGTGAVTHSDKLHTTVVRDQTGFGLRFADLSDDAILIAAVEPNSPAERSGCIYPGDRVLAVNHRNVALDMLTAKDATALMESSPAGRVSLHVQFDVLDSIVPASGVFNVRLLRRGASGLGLTIAASKDNEFVVCDVKKGSPAHRAGSLLPGDRLLAVNGTSLEQCSAEHIARILQQGEQVIALKVERCHHTPDFECERRVTCTVELQRYGGPIGITIAGSEAPLHPITVSGLTPGGLAEQTGALLVGDQILAINDHSLVGEPMSTAHALLHSSPDLVCLKISRLITPNGRSPLQPPSVDSAVESWGSSHLDLTPSPDHTRPIPPKQTTQLLDEITQDNLNIQRELEILSKEISEQSRAPGWEETNVPEANIDSPERCEDRDSCPPTQWDSFEMSNLSDTRQWQYLNASQPSIRSEFQSYNLHTVELKKDPVYEDFGFSVSDGLYERGVFINRIRKGGPADLSQCLQPYDRILQVNGTCTQDFDCCLTVPLIATAGENLTLLVARPCYQHKLDGETCEVSQSNYVPYLTSPATINTIKRIVV